MPRSAAHRTYDAECAHHGWQLVPFVLESYGALGSSACRFLEQISAHSTDRSPADFLAHATNMLSVAYLQVGNAHVAQRGAAEIHLRAYRRGLSHLPHGDQSAIRHGPGVNQRRRTVAAFTARCVRGFGDILHAGYQTARMHPASAAMGDDAAA